MLGNSVGADTLEADLVPATGDGSGWRLRSHFDGLEVNAKPVTVGPGQTVPVGTWGDLALTGERRCRRRPGASLVARRARTRTDARARRLPCRHDLPDRLGERRPPARAAAGAAACRRRSRSPKPKPKPKQKPASPRHDDDHRDDDDRRRRRRKPPSEAEAKAAEAEARAPRLPPDAPAAAGDTAARPARVRLSALRRHLVGRHLRRRPQRRPGRLAPRRRPVRQARNAGRRRRRRHGLRCRLEPRRRLAALAPRSSSGTRSTTRTSPATRRSRGTTTRFGRDRCSASSATPATRTRPIRTCISRCTRTACSTSATTAPSTRRPTSRAGAASTRSGCCRRSSCRRTLRPGRARVTDFRRLLALRPARPRGAAAEARAPSRKTGSPTGPGVPCGRRSSAAPASRAALVAAALLLLLAVGAVGLTAWNGRSR